MQCWKRVYQMMLISLVFIIVLVADFENNFHKYTTKEVSAFNFPYDFGSVMHYDKIRLRSRQNQVDNTPEVAIQGL